MSVRSLGVFLLCALHSVVFSIDNEHYSPYAVRQGEFYLERQQDGLCALHALNAFMGEKYVTAAELTSFTSAYFLELFGKDVSSSLLADAHCGNDPYMLFLFLQNKAEQTHDTRLQHLSYKEFTSKNKKDGIRYLQALEERADIDRIIIGRDGHFVAFRREALTNRWVLLDSLKATSSSPQPIYDEISFRPLLPSEYVARYSYFSSISKK